MFLVYTTALDACQGWISGTKSHVDNIVPQFWAKIKTWAGDRLGIMIIVKI
jgi:hypothetical protein